MASAAGSNNSARSSHKLASIFKRHELKFLNLSLVFYLCFGVLLFEFLGEFAVQPQIKYAIKSDISGHRPAAAAATPASSSSSGSSSRANSTLVELREVSARRMWNITNRLNILYESNWTRLMLDELQEFERRLLDKLTREAIERQQAAAGEPANEDQEKEDDDDDDDDEQDSEKSKRKRSERDSKNRIRSLKKSLIHSLSTITTVGFSQRIQSSAGKLATVIYGLLGIPLLFCSVAKTGKRVAHSTRNGLLIVRHYLFSLPVHYLCCSCNLIACFRCLLWCCCCCCCSYLCCCLPSDQLRGKNKCCDPGKAPKLKLGRPRRRSRRRFRRRSLGDATRPATGDQQRQQAPFVIGATPGVGNAFDALSPAPQSHQQQKLVRFDEQQASRNAKKKKRKTNSDDCDSSSSSDDSGDYEEREDDLSYTQGVFFTSLTALSLYLLVGAYFYSTYANCPLIDALFVCYSMLSTSKFPGQDSSGEQMIYSDPRTLYEHLNATSTSNSNSNLMQQQHPLGGESETIKWLYLLIGLNLVSACGHFAKLWLTNKLNLKECPISRSSSSSTSSSSSSSSSASELNKRPACNGQIVHHSYQPAGQHSSQLQQQNPSAQSGSELQLVASGVGQLMATSGDHFADPNLANHRPTTQYQGQPMDPSQVDLSELFLVQSHSHPTDPNSPNELQYMSGGGHQHQQPASDVSLTSDRSTDRGSLCLHHQQHNHPLDSSSAIYSSSANHHLKQQHHRTPSQSHLYLPRLDQQQQQQQSFIQLPQELDCDESVEMDMMLRSCLTNGDSANKLRSSSSSTQLSSPHPSNQLPAVHHQQQQHQKCGTLSRVRNSFDKQQDSSLNDGSNTISSTTSSRTVKLPHMRSNQHIGFILNSDQQVNNINNLNNINTLKR